MVGWCTTVTGTIAVASTVAPSFSSTSNSAGPSTKVPVPVPALVATIEPETVNVPVGRIAAPLPTSTSIPPAARRAVSWVIQHWTLMPARRGPGLASVAVYGVLAPLMTTSGTLMVGVIVGSAPAGVPPKSGG